MELISYLILAFFHQIYMHPISPKHTCFSFCWPLSSCPATFAIWYRVSAGPQSAFESLLLDMCVKQAPHPMILICSFLTGGLSGYSEPPCCWFHSTDLIRHLGDYHGRQSGQADMCCLCLSLSLSLNNTQTIMHFAGVSLPE